MRAPVGPDALEGVEEQAQLTLPSDELRAHRREAARLLGHGAARPHGAERGDRIRLALRRDRPARRVFDGRARERLRERTDDDLVRLRPLLQPSRDVHRIAGHEELLLASAACDGLA